MLRESELEANLMGKSSAAANVIDLEAFRQRKMRDSKENESAMPSERDAAMFVPVWFCWVPLWAPVVQ
jgi:hypothetical protein